MCETGVKSAAHNAGSAENIANMTPEDVAKRFHVSRESLERLRTYVDHLETWQTKINLVAPSALPEIWTRHIADGLQLIRLIPENARTIVDIGSGSGVPGIVLAIALAERPDLRVHLIESNGKKAAFLREAVRQTGAAAKVHAVRVERLYDDRAISHADVVTARAVAPLPKLLELAAPLFKNGAIGLFCKGQDVDTELTEATKYWRISFSKQPSEIDSRGCILDIREIERVSRL